MSKEHDKKNVEEKLIGFIGNKGELTIYYGGYEIVVNDNVNFKWAEVFNCALQFGFNIYVGLKENKLNIIIKQNW
jgi:hypothetical protein